VKPELPSIVRTAEAAAVAIEKAVAGFPRLHRYTHGSVLRVRAMDVWESALRTWRQRDRQAELIEQLSDKIDGLKLAMQLGRQIGAFRSSGEFEAVYRTVADLGRMCGGWKKQHAKRLNPERQQHDLPERPQILSSSRPSVEGQI
jgi:hypothetical protein